MSVFIKVGDRETRKDFEEAAIGGVSFCSAHWEVRAQRASGTAQGG